MVARILDTALGNIDKTVTFRNIDMTATQADMKNADSAGIRKSLTEYSDINTLVIIGGNPVYDAGRGSFFLRIFEKAENVIHLSSHFNETSQKAGWHIPRAHFLESWGDTRALNGTLSVIQPMIEPLFGGHSDVEFLNLLATGRTRSGYEIVRDTWKDILTGGGFEKKWRRVLHDGIFVNKDAPKGNLRIKNVKSIDGYFNQLKTSKDTAPTADNLELTFQVSPATFDGRYANNGWLQELPHPTSKLTWDNAARVNPKTAGDLGVVNGDVVKISNAMGEIELPVWIVPGLADYTIAIELGYGRTAAGRVGNGVGANAYSLRPTPSSYFATGVKIAKTGRTYKLASTQDHGAMEGRAIVREGTLEEYRKHPEFAREMVEHPPLKGIYNEHDYSQGNQWGMTIDLNTCTGCNACTIACQSENNIPVVGKERVMEGREMHWIRLDRYFTGDTDDPRMVFMPVACQHCENAPCEQVCPVAATVHDSEGLNVMTYNRCIGTRYCSNNCPYKVRRFNFFNYTTDLPEIVRMAMNPDVTMRSRGVMEKCTFCTQRITRAKIKAKREGRGLRDGEVTAACQQACPAGAIVFGNINDPNSKVSESKKRRRGYGLLAEFNMQPRNTFLARIRNPHPDLKDYVPDKG
jgi:molybdopterin-containing oxidoreductase family iron-sulfur binding subunit